MSSRFQGGCQCGAVRYVAEGEPVNERVCHCRLCQKAIGAAFNARAMFARDQVTVQGPVAIHSYPSSEISRGFCPQCGTTLFSERAAAGVIGLTAGSLDDPAQFRPTMHFWTSSRQPWVALSDGLPNYPEAPPG